MLLRALAFLAGVLVLLRLPNLPAWPWVPALAAMGLALALHSRLRLLAWPVAGLAWALGHAWITAPSSIPSQALGALITAEGTVQALPRRQGGTVRFFFEARRLSGAGGHWSGRWRLRVSWYRHAPPLAPGERWRLHLKIRPVSGFRNPGGFDYSAWLLTRGVHYRARVQAGERLAAAGWNLDRLRARWSAHIDRLLDGSRAAGLIRALAVGDRSGLDPRVQQWLTETGTRHLVAISGLHVGLVAGLVWWLGRWLWRRVPGACARTPDRVAAAPLAMLAALGYAALSGFSLPTQRALLMLLVVMGALMARRQLAATHALGLALLLVLLWDPLAPLGAGFWLSFAAVALLLWINHGRVRPLRSQFGVALGLWPLLAWQGLPGSLLAPLVNLAAIPLFSLVVVPATGLALAWEVLSGWTGHWPLYGLEWLLERFLRLLQWAAQWNPPLTGREAWLWPLLALVLVLLGWRVTAPRMRPWLMIGCLVLALWGAWRAPRPPPPNAFDLELLDVGQGLSVVVRTARHVLVYDTGPRYGTGFDAGSAVLLPYLRNEDVRRVDLLMVSHGDRDHAGGTRALLAGLPVTQVWSGEPARLGLKRPVIPCRAGARWWWDGVRFELLWPQGKGWRGNDASCVLRISSGRSVLLLTGDAEAPVERRLVRERSLAASVVVAGHHGSAGSSAPAFVAATRPSWVLISAGLYNPWHFPREAVLKRWCRVGARVLNTAWSGAIGIRFTPAGPGPARTHAQVHRRWWWHRPRRRLPPACSMIAGS